MLNVEAPANFVLTLQSVPPFLVENILALALVVLLAVPLIAHIQILLDNTTKAAMGASSRRAYHSHQRQDPRNRTVVMHYPSPVKLDTRSNSDVNIQLGSMRTTCSTPAVKRSSERLPADERRISSSSSSSNDDRTNGDDRCKEIFREMILRKQKTCLPLKRSSSFLATNAQLPIIDISAFDYDSYRHKLVEMTLKRQYGDRQAPGNVVFNSIHLNSVGSESHIQLSEKYSHSLFDFVEDYYDATKALSRKEKEYLHPLDHFLAKSSEKPATTETGTETKESSTELDQVPEMIAFRDDSPIRTASLTSGKRKIQDTSKHASKLTVRSRRSSSIPRNPSQAPVTSKPELSEVDKLPSVAPATRQLFNRAESVKPPENRSSRASSKDGIEEKKSFASPRTSRSRTPRVPASSGVTRSNKIGEKIASKRDASIEPGKSSCESFVPGATRPGEYSEAMSTDRDDKESVTCASSEFISSSEAGSSYCSSRPRDKHPRSRASSLSSRSRTVGSLGQTRQWHSGGTANGSFDRQRDALKTTSGKIGKTKLCARPRSTGGRFAWDVPDVPGQCDASTDEKPASPTITERPRTASAAFNRRRTPEKGKLSETVLPVLESVIDLRVDPNCEGLDGIDAGDEPEARVCAKESSEHREFKRVARSRGKHFSSASFVKSPAGNTTKSLAGSVKILSAEKSGAKASSEVATKSSSGIKTSSSRAGSVSRLPVHVGADKAKIRKFIEARQSFAGEAGNLPEKSLGREEKRSTGICRINRRPRTAGCVGSRTSSLSPKMELSLESLPVVAGVTIEKLQTAETKKSSRNAMAARPSGRTTIPVSNSNAGKATSSAVSARGSSKDCPGSTEVDQRDDSPKRPFLRARSGRYGAPKLETAEKKPRDSAERDARISSKLGEEEKAKDELSVLPREESKAALVMRRELKIYIKKIKHILANRNENLRAKDLASLSITEAIIPELRHLLSPREIQDLRKLMDREEKRDGNVPDVGAISRI